MCGNTSNSSSLPTIILSIPEGQRIGQNLFNFLEWLRVEKKLATEQSSRMADPFHLSNNDFGKYYNEYIKQIHSGGVGESKEGEDTGLIGDKE